MAYMQRYCKKCGAKRHARSKSELCRKCFRANQIATSYKYSPEYINNGGSQSIGKDGKTHYERNKTIYIKKSLARKKEWMQRFIEYKKTLRCTDCHLKDFRVIDFDHLDSNKKEHIISKMVSRCFSWINIMKEISKCEPVCSNCHRIRTYERRNALLA